MSGADIKVAVHAVFVTAPQQTCMWTSFGVMAQGIAFLNALPAPWTTLLAPVRCVPGRGRCREGCGATAGAAAIAAIADHQPPAAPTVVATAPPPAAPPLAAGTWMVVP